MDDMTKLPQNFLNTSLKYISYSIKVLKNNLSHKNSISFHYIISFLYRPDDCKVNENNIFYSGLPINVA